MLKHGGFVSEISEKCSAKEYITSQVLTVSHLINFVLIKFNQTFILLFKAFCI